MEVFKRRSKRAKRIAVIQFYFYPDISAVAQLLGDLLEEVASGGEYDVTVFCGSSRYARQVDRREKDQRRRRSVKIKRIITTNFGKKNFFTRSLDFLVYYITVFFYFLFSNKWDVFVTMTSPPLIGFVVSIATLLSRIPLVYYVEDLYPELLYDIGYIRRPWLIRKLRILNNTIIARASKVITIGEYMTEKIEANYRRTRGKITQIDNWAIGIDYAERERQPEFTLLYSGNMGLAHDFSKLKLLIREMKSLDGLHYKFIGGGESRNAIEQIFRAEAETRVSFSGYSARTAHYTAITDADLFIISQKRETIGDILPSKLYSYLAAGRPLLFLGPRRSEIGKLILNNDIGVVLETEDDVSKVAAFIENSTGNQRLCNATGRRARKLFDSRFSLAHSVGKFRRVLEEVSA
jgi:glycosyltransferase involved in cell wall biosynthesis